MTDETQAGAAQAPAGAGPLLRLRGVSKSFGPVQGLNEVDFEVHRGEVVALVGDNGAGKSTLITAISGVGPADAGSFEFDHLSITIPEPATVALGALALLAFRRRRH